MMGSTWQSLRSCWKQLWTWTASLMSTSSVHPTMLICRFSSRNLTATALCCCTNLPLYKGRSRELLGKKWLLQITSTVAYND